MKQTRVALGAVPKMIDSIIRDLLSDVPGIQVVSTNSAGDSAGYDVLVLNELEEEADSTGYNSPSPSAGIVILGREGRTATVFRRINEEFRLERSAPHALEHAILLAAGES